MSGNDKPPKAAYNAWAQANQPQPAWENMTAAQQLVWQNVAQAAINAATNLP